MGEIDIKNMWADGHRKEADKKKLSKDDIMSYRRKQSKDMKTSTRRLIYFDIGYKVVIAFAFGALIYFLKGGEKTQIIAGLAILFCLGLAGIEYGYLNQLNLLKEDNPIIDALKEKIAFLKKFYKKYVFLAALSSPLMVLSGFLLYEYFKYGKVMMASFLEDPVPYVFLLAAFLIGYYSAIPFYEIRVRELEECVEEVDDDYVATIKIAEQEKRKRMRLILFTLLALLGVFVFILALWFYQNS